MKTTRASFLLAITILCAAFCFAQQTPPPVAQSPVTQSSVAANNLQLVIEGKVINVHDGDTVTVLDQNNKKFHIRLQGIDAPELKQEFGSVSQQNLSRMVLGKQVTIFWTKVDKYRRTVGTIKIDGQDMNIEQVKAGLAWHFKKYEDEQEPQDRLSYAAAEQHARATKLGLWQDPSPTMPGDWRQEVKAKRWGPPPPEGTIVGNKNSKKYQRPDCSGYRDTSEKNRVFFKTIEEAEAAGYKRAGNCPAEIQVAQTKASPTTVAVSQPMTTATTSPVASPVAAPNSAPETATIQTKPVVTPTDASPAATNNGDERIIGNKNSKKYQRPDCSGYLATSEKNRVYFNTVAEAEAAGYTRAGNCPAEIRVAHTKPTAGTKEVSKPTPAAVASPTASPVATTDSAPAVETDAAATPTDAHSAATSDVVLKIIGNKNSKVYHLPGCSSYNRVSEKNQVKFDTAAQAEAAGYKLAGNCSATKNAKE